MESEIKIIYNLQVFKIPLNCSNNKIPDLAAVREQVLEAATKLWLNYVDMERKSLHRVPWELHNQIQSVSNVHGGTNFKH